MIRHVHEEDLRRGNAENGAELAGVVGQRAVEEAAERVFDLAPAAQRHAGDGPRQPAITRIERLVALGETALVEEIVQ